MKRPYRISEAEILVAAMNYQTPKAFERGDPSAYQHAKENGLLPRATMHMRKQPTYSQQACLLSARQHTRVIDWEKADKGAYRASRRRGWYRFCVAHMDGTRGGIKH